MKKVLIIAYHFPPSNAVGALRPARFAEYLPEFGWEPVVLTAPADGAETPQFSRTSSPATTVATVDPWPGPRDLLMSLRRTKSVNPAAVEQAPEEGRLVARASAPGPKTWKRRLRELVLVSMWVPDDRQGWIPPVTFAGLRKVSSERPAAVFVTAPPPSAAVAAALVARISGLPLIVDLRDPWCGSPFRGTWYHEGWGLQLDCRLEGWVLEHADAVVCVTENHARQLRRRYASASGRIDVIPNGFDVHDFRGLSRSNGERFTITYAGNFYHSRSPVSLFRALRSLSDRGVLDASSVRLEFIGDCARVQGRDVRDMAAEFGFEASLELPGRLPHPQALQRLVDADLLLLLAAGQPDQVPTKTYEYLAAGPPILLLGGDGATADVLRAAERSYCVETDDVTRIADVVSSLFAQKSRGTDGPWVCPVDAEKWSRREHTRHLAGLLDAVALPV